MFIQGKKYNRQSELHDIYGGNRQSGISPCANNPIIFIFTSPVGKEHGYQDKWLTESLFSYTGEGQFGNMELSRGNFAIKNHKTDGRKIYLFKQIKTGEYEYEGEFEYTSHEIILGDDSEKKKRDMIVFKLRKINI